MLSRLRAFPALAGLLLLLPGPLFGAGSASAEDAAKVAPADDPEAPPVFVPIEGLQVPIIESGDVGGRMRLEIVLQGVSADVLPTIRHDLPRYRDQAYAAAVEYARLHVSPYAAVDARRLSGALDAALKDPALRRVLIVRVSAEPA